jgi:hypothetical protein
MAVGSSCSVTVQFAPTAAQAYSGQLVFTSNASMTTTSIPLNGNGGEPVAGFGPPGANQRLDFSSLLVGQTGPAEIILLYNNGTVPLTVYLSQIAVTSGFALVPGGNCTSSLLPNQYCSIAIQFAPTTAGEISGTLSVSSNDPVHPTITTSLTGTAFAAYPVPTISSLQNGSYPMSSGTSPITMQVNGTNFFPASVVYINGVAQATMYANDTYLGVTFSPSLLSAVGQIPVTVVNPAPGGSSAPYPLTVYLSIPLNASALTIDPVGGLLYAAIPASATQNPNTIIPINPATGATMTPIPVASGPRALAVSGDGSELYVASTGVLQRINLQTLAIEKTFNLPVDSEWGQTYAGEMHVVPGSPKSIVVELSANVDPAEDGAALYNDSGLVNWLPGVAARPPLAIDSFTFTSATSIYALPMTSTFFTSLQVTPAGLSGTGGEGEFNEQTGSIVRSDGTLLYTNSGEVWDPSTQKLLGTYLESDGSQLFYTAGVVPDKPNGHSYFLDGFGGGLYIDVYDQASYALLGTVPFQSIYSPDATDLLRWGSKGFAFRAIDISQTDPTSNQIVIVTSDLVTSRSITPIPILASVSPTNVYADGPAYSMQLTGSGFTSSSQVLVNGNPRATTFVSGTSLTAQVLASDIAATGQLDVQVTTPAPGGGTSNYVIVSIKPSLTTPAVTLTPSATTLTTGQALTVGVAVSGGNSGLKPTGTVILTGGGFTSPAMPLASGAASIDIPPGSLSAGADVLTVAYTPDSAGSSFYKAATGTASITVTAALKNASTVTVTAASPAITNEQSDIVSIAVAGTAELPVPTGTATLVSGSYRAQQALASGAASVTVPAGALGSGANVLTVTYSGDGAYVGSTGTTSVRVAQVVMAVPPVTGLTPGGSTTANVTLSAGSNYSGTMNMSCTLVASPNGAQSLPACSLSPVPVKIAAGGTGSTVLTVQTTGSSAATNVVPSPMNLFGLGGGTILAGLLLIGVPARGRRWMVIPVLLWVFVVTGASGCGGGGNSNSGSGPGGASVPPTTAGTYTFTITGVDSANSSITSSINLTLTVQ